MPPMTGTRIRGYDGFHLSFDVDDIGDLPEPLSGHGALPFEW
jgi:hypothetical protein